MFGIDVKITERFKAVQEAADRAIYQNIRHAAFSIRKYIQDSIRTSPQASEPGEPVSTRGKRGNVKNSIFVAADDNTALIGPRFSFVGDVMEAHEFGKTYKGDRFAARPTMGPGLEANTDRFANSFRGSIGE
jgi:phage gpG-like protein